MANNSSYARFVFRVAEVFAAERKRINKVLVVCIKVFELLRFDCMIKICCFINVKLFVNDSVQDDSYMTSDITMKQIANSTAISDVTIVSSPCDSTLFVTSALDDFLSKHTMSRISTDSQLENTTQTLDASSISMQSRTQCGSEMYIKVNTCTIVFVLTVEYRYVKPESGAGVTFDPHWICLFSYFMFTSDLRSSGQNWLNTVDDLLILYSFFNNILDTSLMPLIWNWHYRMRIRRMASVVI